MIKRIFFYLILNTKDPTSLEARISHIADIHIFFNFLNFCCVQVPALVPPVLAALADGKATVRAAAVAALNTVVKETAVREVFVNEMFSSVLAKGGQSSNQLGG